MNKLIATLLAAGLLVVPATAMAEEEEIFVQAEPVTAQQFAEYEQEANEGLEVDEEEDQPLASVAVRHRKHRQHRHHRRKRR